MERITKTVVCLHNYLQLTKNANYIPAEFVDCEDNTGNTMPGAWRSNVRSDEGGLLNLTRISGNRYTFDAGKVRDGFRNYFNSLEGQVSWQLQHVINWGEVHG